MRYVGIGSATGLYFQASKNSAVAEFAAVADCHPVFKLIPLARIANAAVWAFMDWILPAAALGVTASQTGAAGPDNRMRPVRDLEFGEDAGDVVADCLGLMNSCRAMSPFGLPAAMRSRISRSRVVSSGKSCWS